MLVIIAILFVLGFIIAIDYKKKNLIHRRRSSFDFNNDSYCGTHYDFTDGGDGDGDGGGDGGGGD